MAKTKNATFWRITPIVPGFVRIKIQFEGNPGTFGLIPLKMKFPFFRTFSNIESIEEIDQSTDRSNRFFVILDRTNVRISLSEAKFHEEANVDI